MKRSRILTAGLMIGAATILAPLARAQTPSSIVNSPHDFTATTNFWVNGVTNWVPNNNVCEECHTIHKAKSTYKNGGPLWAHNLSANTYTMFSSPNLTADGYPNGGTLSTSGGGGWASLACLSCHDGSVAINQQNGASSVSVPVNIPSWAQIAVGGTDLSGTHPVGIDYGTCYAKDGYLNIASGTVQNAGVDSGTKTIQQELLFDESGTGGGNSMMECASCHDIHRVKGMSATVKDNLKIGTTTSSQTLCLACHIK